MSAPPVAIKRYPNRRFYAKHTSKYVSLPEIEELICQGHTVQIRDSQTGEDITRPVLTQMIIDRQPEKMALFPTDMLHFIVRSNDLMAGFLRDYFRHSLTYLDYLQHHNPAAQSLVNPMHWVKAWLDGISSAAPSSFSSASSSDGSSDGDHDSSASLREEELAERVKRLEERIRQLEAKEKE